MLVFCFSLFQRKLQVAMIVNVKRVLLFLPFTNALNGMMLDSNRHRFHLRDG